jgi:hypothetical protein
MSETTRAARNASAPRSKASASETRTHIVFTRPEAAVFTVIEGQKEFLPAENLATRFAMVGLNATIAALDAALEVGTEREAHETA